MKSALGRRDFLRLSALSLGGLAAPSLAGLNPQDEIRGPIGLGRVTIDMIRVYNQPDSLSERVGRLWRDDLVEIYEALPVPRRADYTPLWYRIEPGYIQSTCIQRVECQRANPVLPAIPTHGILGEVTVPYTPSYRYTSADGWQPLYRLYFSSVHWITAIEEGPDGSLWYCLLDQLLSVRYHVNPRHLRPIPPEEYAPIHTDVPSQEKRIIVSISNQTLTAYEGDQVVLHKYISSGTKQERPPAPGELPTETPLGSFRIQTKMPSRHMGNGQLTGEIGAAEYPGVPWTMLFTEEGVALHGVYWHDCYGIAMSHGCVNMRNPHAKWLFRWTDPVFEPGDYYVRREGTRVIVTA